jgi:STE24 endopeptidase
MNPYLLIILVSLLGHYLLHAVADWLNLRHLSPEVPAEVADACDAETYRKSQRYLRENTRFGILVDTVELAVVLVFVLAGGFNLVDRVARLPGWGEVGTGLLFAGLLMAGMQLLHLPFSIYDTFVIEERYGFNRTTARTFALDLVRFSPR